MGSTTSSKPIYCLANDMPLHFIGIHRIGALYWNWHIVNFGCYVIEANHQNLTTGPSERYPKINQLKLQIWQKVPLDPSYMFL